MHVSYERVRGSKLMKVDVDGKFDREATELACVTLGKRAGGSECQGVLLDLRDFHCDVSITDVFEVCTQLTRSTSLYEQRVAVLVDREPTSRMSDLTSFLELCGQNRGLRIRAFSEEAEATAWLEAAALPAEK